jgi:hypothetical protein
MDKKLVRRYHRLKALADGGATEGERDNARSLMDALVKKHGLDVSELNPIKRVYFRINQNPFHAQLLYQVVGTVVGWEADRYNIWKHKNPNLLGADLTETQAMRVKKLLTYYRTEWDAALEDFFKAWLLKNSNLLRPAKEVNEYTRQTQQRTAHLQKVIDVLPMPDQKRLHD